MTNLDIAAVGALIGDPARANMLAALLDGTAHTATKAAHIASLACRRKTASSQLANLAADGSWRSNGRSGISITGSRRRWSAACSRR